MQEHMVASHDPVLVMTGGEKDMFSSDFHVPSAEQKNRKYDGEI